MSHAPDSSERRHVIVWISVPVLLAVLYVASWPIVEMNYVPIMQRVRQQRIVDASEISTFYRPLHRFCRAYPEANPLIAYWRAWVRWLGKRGWDTYPPWDPLPLGTKI
jgi:hypothetical protein